MITNEVMEVEPEVKVVEAEPEKPARAQITVASPKNINWTELYCAWIDGLTFDQIARRWGISPDLVQRAANKQKWAALAHKRPRPISETTEEVAIRKAEVTKFIAKKKRVLEALLTDVAALSEDFTLSVIAPETKRADGTPVGTVRQYFHNKGVITHVDRKMTVAERLEVSKYFTLVLSLGDKLLSLDPNGGGSEADPKAVQAQAPAQITLVLPGLIAKPRNEKDVAHTVIDLADVPEAEQVKPDL